MDMTPRDLMFYHRGWHRRLIHQRRSIAMAAVPFLQPPKGKGSPVTVDDVVGLLPEWGSVDD